jgi:hypothetical protein
MSFTRASGLSAIGHFLAAVFSVLIASAICRTGQAQVLYGSIVGNVLDASGAAVPGATVKVAQISTNETREATTNEVCITGAW